MNEIDIIKGSLKNDRASQKLLYEKYYSSMMLISLRYSQNNEEAKKIVQQGFLKIFNQLQNFNQKTLFEEWIKKIMIETAVEFLKKDKQSYLIVSTVHANDAQLLSGVAINDNEIISKAKEDNVLKAVQELTPAYRTVFNLFQIENYSHQQIAELLDISEETSRLNLSKAKFSLRKNLLRSIK